MFSHIQTNLHLKLKCLKRVKVHWRYLALIPVWDIEKELFAPKLLMKLTVKYEIWGHQFFYGMIFMSCKKRLKAFLLVKFVTNFSANFLYFGTYFWASIAFERYHFFSGCSYDWASFHVFLWKGKFLCFRRKVTSQGVIKEFFLNRNR